MKSLWYIFLLISLMFPASGQAIVEFKTISRIISGEEIKSAGLTRIADLLLLIDDWQLNTIDGYTWYVSPNALSSYQRQNWIIMLDNQRIDLKLFEVQSLNQLPLSLDQIDSVEIVSYPQIYRGEFTGSGLLHIYTSKPQPGVSLRGFGMAGNETGDPGPYKYTKYNSPNVDRIGKDGSVAVDFGWKNFYVRAGVFLQEHTLTDYSIRRRIHDSTEYGWGSMYRIAPSFKLGFDTGTAKNEFFLGYSNTHRYFFFFKPFGREIPVNYHFTHLGAAGAYNPTDHHAISYRLKYSLLDPQKRQNQFDLDFAVKLQNLSANLEAMLQKSWYRAKIGLGYDRYLIHSNYHLEPDFFRLGKVYAGLAGNFARNFNQNLGTMLVLTGDAIAVKTSLTTRWQFHPDQTLQSVLSYSQRLFQEDNSLWYWTERGYGLLQDNDIDYTIMGSFVNSSQLTIDMIYQYRFSHNLSMEIAGRYRSFSDVYFEKQSFMFNPYFCSVSAPVEVYPKNSGAVLGGHVLLKQQVSSKLLHQFFYSYHNTVSGNNIFNNVWKTIPEHKLVYRITWFPVKNLSVWSMFSYFSSTNWPEYENIDGQYCDYWNIIKTKYQSKIHSVPILDLQLQKYLWHRQLLASLLVRNVWNQNYRYHPIGASYDLSFHIQGTFYFNF